MIITMRLVYVNILYKTRIVVIYSCNPVYYENKNIIYFVQMYMHSLTDLLLTALSICNYMSGLYPTKWTHF